MRPGRKPLFSCSKSVWQDSAVQRATNGRPYNEKENMIIFAKLIYVEAPSLMRRPLPRWAVRDSDVWWWDCLHSRVIDCNNDISTSALSDAALMKLCLQILLSKAALTAAARRPKDTRLFDKIDKNGLNSGFLQSSQQKAYLIRLAILLYYNNIILVIRC